MLRECLVDNVRIDKWLWAARFYKTRSLASKAVSGGHVYLNGQRVKPARAVQEGDAMEIRKGHLTFSIVVLGLRDRRGPASVARELYEESEESIAKRQEVIAERRLITAPAVGPGRKPDKRDRRKIRQFLKKQ